MSREDTGSPTGADRRGVLALIRVLADSGLELLHGAARMATSEGRIILHRLSVRLGLYFAGLCVAAMGALLVLVGASFLLARAFGADPWVGLVVVGAAAGVAGSLAARRALRSLGAPDLAFQATLAELDADVAALRGGDATRDPSR
jgi:hypothetical protein